MTVSTRRCFLVSKVWAFSWQQQNLNLNILGHKKCTALFVVQEIMGILFDFKEADKDLENDNWRFW